MPTTRLRELAQIRMGATLRGRDATRPDSAGSHQFIQISDINDNGSFRTQDFTRITPRESVSEKLLLQEGDLIFPNRGSRTTAAQFQVNNFPTLVGSQFFILRPDPEQIHPAYLAWFLRTKKAAHYFDTRRRGSNVLTLNKDALADLLVPLPSLNTQDQITNLDDLQRQGAELETRLATRRADLLERTLLEKIGKD